MSSSSDQRTVSHYCDFTPHMERSVPLATVSVKLGELLSLLDNARQEDRLWVRDFQDDAVQVSSDLFQVARAAAQM